jgi:hypothetical protein
MPITINPEKVFISFTDEQGVHVITLKELIESGCPLTVENDKMDFKSAYLV